MANATAVRALTPSELNSPARLRLLVGIPCLNEEATVGAVIQSIPRDIAGIVCVDVLVVDDGSDDKTGEVARANGAKVVRHPHRRGLGKAFDTITQHVLAHGYDVMVNIDGDGQFNSDDIRRLVEPIVNSQADFVTASRFIDSSHRENMPLVKLMGNHAMSYLVSQLARKRFFDVSCGFRAYSREALLHLNIHGNYTHTQETFLNLTESGLSIREVPISVKYFPDRKSRVAGNLWKYGTRTFTIIGRAYRDYYPLKFFWGISAIFFSVGACFAANLFIHFFRTGVFKGQIWSGFLAGGLGIVGLSFFILGAMADMFTRMRKNQERILFMLRKFMLASTRDNPQA